MSGRAEMGFQDISGYNLVEPGHIREMTYAFGGEGVGTCRRWGTA